MDRIVHVQPKKGSIFPEKRHEFNGKLLVLSEGAEDTFGNGPQNRFVYVQTLHRILTMLNRLLDLHVPVSALIYHSFSCLWVGNKYQMTDRVNPIKQFGLNSVFYREHV